MHKSQWGSGKKVSAPWSAPILQTPPTSGKGLPIVHKQLTVEERKERTTKGLCFNYDEEYSPDHKCKGRLFRMDANRNCLVELVKQ